MMGPVDEQLERDVPAKIAVWLRRQCAITQPGSTSLLNTMFSRLWAAPACPRNPEGCDAAYENPSKIAVSIASPQEAADTGLRALAMVIARWPLKSF